MKLADLPGGSKGYFLANLALRETRPLVVMAGEDLEAEGLSADVEAWLGLKPSAQNPQLIVYPEFDAPGRLAALGQMKQARRFIVFASKAASQLPTTSPAQLQTQTLELRPGQLYPRTALLETLAQGGFDRTDIVQMEGEVAIRGEVIDIWPADAQKPWRLVFDGDTLETLRDFESGTQRSGAYLEPQKLLPMKETKSDATLKDHVPTDAVWFEDDPLAAETLNPGLRPAGVTIESTVGLTGSLSRAAEAAGRAKAEGKKVIFFSHNAGESERLQELLDEHMGSRGTEGMNFVVGPLRSGFLTSSPLPTGQAGPNVSVGGPSMDPRLRPAGKTEQGMLVLTNAEIFNRARHRPRLPKFKGGGAIQEVHDVKPGDYVVHEHYGVGRYKGLDLLRAAGQEAEYLKLEYAKGDKLYVPLFDFKQVQRYSGSEGAHPRLSSLDTSAWERVKARVKESVQELAKDLLKVHAARAALPGHAFSADSHLEQEFAASFLYEETSDQLRTIEEIKRDMMSTKPMDRLLLGDVGYGKTEVAMRAAMKAIADSKQVAVLVPTTILAEQHFRTFCERFADYPAKIGMLSRFQTAKEEKEVLVGAASGTLDMVIGTHRLLQKDVHFHNLGLLVIDEEHRFGVKNKEQIKKMRQHTDVLTMTATPIPRTLSFALAGMRDLSVIETPPTGRLPITTHVGPYDDAVIKEAIQKELARHGQVFYVHNRVQSLPTRLKFLQMLMPGISVGVVHGQMSGPAIEKVMWEFVHQKHQILLATTIIESGIDIPTANTLIVDEAEEFGLAQLYQLRGRVGRERTKAYCYLFFSPGVPLSGDARARLEALREFTALGSGQRLAMRDMEIRGAGNLLGQQQHGHIAAVGLDLYSQMLQDEISALRGEPPATSVRFPSMDLSLHAYLPADYLPSEELRILFYKKLVSAETQQALETVQNELSDRFGALPPEAQTLMRVSRLRIIARDLGIDGLVQKPSSLEIRFLQNTPIQPATILELAHTRTGVRFKPGPPFTLIIEKLAYESTGTLHYLESLFTTLTA